MTYPSRRKPLVVANWKMNGNPSLVAAFSNKLTSECFSCDVAICPPLTFIAGFSNTALKWGAQDVSEHANGAFTGEVSAEMLRSVGCSYVIVGHSERRQYHAETDAQVSRKIKQSLLCGLTPIVCVGEPLGERSAGTAADFVVKQLDALKSELTSLEFAKCVLAYEPIWAIGTGETATPHQAQEMHSIIRRYLLEWDASLASVKILYGGSVNAANASHLFSQNDVDGGLVGGASLKLEEFVAICKATQ